MKYEASLVGHNTAIVTFHIEWLEKNQVALEIELARNSPDADKVLDFREEVWYHENEIKQHVAKLIGIHVDDLLDV